MIGGFLMEVWLDVKGYEGVYEVSNFGRVRRMPRGENPNPRLMRPGKGGSGYLGLVLSMNNIKKNHMVHRLVAFAFLGDPAEKNMQVAHADGNKLNNHVSNLRWASPRENNFDKYAHGTASFTNGKRRGILSDEDIVAIRLDPRGYTAIGKQYRVTAGMIGSIKRKESYGYVAPHIEGVSDSKRHRKTLPDDTIRSIRKDTRNNQAIADEVGVNRSVIWHIKNRNIYKHVAD
jgi:hypothetical protein